MWSDQWAFPLGAPDRKDVEQPDKYFGGHYGVAKMVEVVQPVFSQARLAMARLAGEGPRPAGQACVGRKRNLLGMAIQFGRHQPIQTDSKSGVPRKTLNQSLFKPTQRPDNAE